MYSIAKIKEIIHAKGKILESNYQINTLLIDSRKVNTSDNSLFFAINGERLDGHNYISDLYKKGLRNFVVEKKEFLDKYQDANVLLVSNSINALQNLVSYHRKQYEIPTVAITGSNGKTIIKEWLFQLLNADFNIVRNPKSYNSQVGVPLSVWNIHSGNNLAIFEAGISQTNEMQHLQKIIKPTIGIFSNIGSAHAQNFKNASQKVKEKLNLFRGAEVLIYCKDHSLVHQEIKNFWINKKTKKPKTISWSNTKHADVEITNKKIRKNYTIIECNYLSNKYTLKIPFIDRSSLENTFHCIVLMLYLKYDEKTINDRIVNLKRIEMRLEQKQGINNCIIINDTYNSDIDSLKIALEFLAQQEQSQKRTLILSDILQTGLSGFELYSSVAEMLNTAHLEKFIGIGTEISKYKNIFTQKTKNSKQYFYANTEEFLKETKDEFYTNEAILLKGARSFQFEKINSFLEEKVHATVFEVDLNALIHNLKYFSSKLKPHTKIMLMVKAFAYGAGSYEIAKFLEFHKVDYLGVAYADEGVLLRNAGITLPIMVLNPEESSFDIMLKHHLEPEIYSLQLLNQFSELVKQSDLKKAFPIHINIDTGMKRLGFDKKDILKLVDTLKKNNHLKVVSIFSHLAASDDKKWDEFTNLQISSFNEAYAELSQLLDIKPIKHIANSNGILRFQNAHFDMVRLGLGLYGVNENIQKNLIPIGTLKSKISQIRNVKKGETIGYGRIGKMTKDGKIAVVAIGYADGLSRALSNGVGNFFIKGNLAPIIGNICMDMTMVNISEIENLKVGDEVEVFGKNIPVSHIAKQMNSITYEVLSSVSQRVKRVFFVD